MNHKPWLQAAASLILSFFVVTARAQDRAPGGAQDGAQNGASWRLAGVEAESRPQAATPAGSRALVFAPAAVGATSQQLTAVFTVSGQGIGLTPTFSTHFGHDFTVGWPACSGDGAGQTCRVAISFLPTLPGLRSDALFVSIAGRRVATVLLSGTGQSPLALLQPTSLAPSVASANDDSAVVDEDGTLYLLDRSAATVTSITAAGVRTRLPIAGLIAPRGVAMDSAGVLYVLSQSAEKELVTFDTVQGLQSSFALPAAASSLDSFSLDAAGDVYAYSSSARMIYKVAADGTSSTEAVTSGTAAPAMIVSITGSMIVSSSQDVFLGGDSLQRVSAGAIQPALKPSGTSSMAVSGRAIWGSSEPIAFDAAGSLYVRTQSSVLQLTAPDFAASAANLPAALAIAPDGGLLSADASHYIHVSRTEATLDFGYLAPGTAPEPQVASLYNGGNLPLTISNIAVRGAGISVAPVPATTCVAGVVLAPGASCGIAVALEASKATVPSGTVSITSDSLNNPATTLPLQVIVHSNAAGSQAAFNPTSLAFPSTQQLVASAPLSVVLSNPGTSPLNFNGIALAGAGSGSYSLTQNCYTALPASLAPGANCTITVIFKPLVAAAQAAVISVGDDLNGIANSSQTVALTGTGTPPPAPIVTFLASTPYVNAATTLTFGNPPVQNNLLPVHLLSNVVVVGTTSAPGTVTISNTGNATLNISSISLVPAAGAVTFPFTQTNTCGATLAPAAKCVVTVIFAPTVGGNISVTLSIADNAAGTPQAFTITGYPTAGDYNMTASATSLTIPAAGGTGQVVMTVTPDPAPFPTAINFSVFGMPAGATYTFSPVSIMAVSSASTANFNITLPAYHPVVFSRLDPHAPSRQPYLPVLPISAALLAGCWAGLRRRRMPWLTRTMQVTLASLLGVAAMSMSACSSGIPVASGVAPGSYPLTITATSANGVPSTFTPPFVVPTTHTLNITLIVQ